MTKPIESAKKPFFLNFRTFEDMPFYKRIIWRIFGKKHYGCDDDYCVTAYEFNNITLVWKVVLYERS
jgi:hypothetical protein